MRLMMAILISMAAGHGIEALEPEVSAHAQAIHTSGLNQVFDFYKAKGEKVYVAEYTGVNGISSIYSPGFKDPQSIRNKAFEAFKASKGTIIAGDKIVAFDEAGQLLDLTSFAR